MSHYAYEVRTMHPIRPSHKDCQVHTFWSDLETIATDRKAMGAALREEGVFGAGESVLVCGKLHGDDRITVRRKRSRAFSSQPEFFILRPILESDEYSAHVLCDDGSTAYWGGSHSYRLQRDLEQWLRPLSSSSAPRTYVLTVDGHEVGGFFVAAGPDFRSSDD